MYNFDSMIISEKLKFLNFPIKDVCCKIIMPQNKTAERNNIKPNIAKTFMSMINACKVLSATVSFFFFSIIITRIAGFLFYFEGELFAFVLSAICMLH